MSCITTQESFEEEAISFTKDKLKSVSSMLSEDYQTGYKEGIEHYLSSKTCETGNNDGEIEYITIIEQDEDGIYDVEIEGLGKMEAERRVITLPKGREVTIDIKFFIYFQPKSKSYVRAEGVQIYFSTSKFVYGPIICNIKTNRKGIFKIDWNAKSYPPRYAKK